MSLWSFILLHLTEYPFQNIMRTMCPCHTHQRTRSYYDDQHAGRSLSTQCTVSSYLMKETKIERYHYLHSARGLAFVLLAGKCSANTLSYICYSRKETTPSRKNPICSAINSRLCSTNKAGTSRRKALLKTVNDCSPITCRDAFSNAFADL